MKSPIAGIANLSSRLGFGGSKAETDSGWSELSSNGGSTQTDTPSNLSSDAILQSLPSFINSLDYKGNWQNISAGTNSYLASLDADNFVQWVSDAVHIQDRVAVLKAADDCLAGTGKTTSEFRLTGVKNENVPQWIELICTPTPEHGVILTILRDISERKQLENSISEARAVSEAASIEKSRFLANMSHELRTPLNAIIGFSEILKSDMLPPGEVEKQREYHELINASANHLLCVLNDVLDMSKIEAGKYEIYPENTELNQIINSVCSMLTPLADKAGVVIDFVEPKESLPFEADSKAIRQILINLVSNAIKFSDPDTEIYIHAERRGRKLSFSVVDQGQGISSENLDRLGEPFCQLDGKKSRKHEGTGLGLSIVKGLVELHKGRFSIESELGRGTTVSIEIPLSSTNSKPVPSPDAERVVHINTHSGSDAADNAGIARLVG